ncbi:hypothetical protein [Collinsella intestinalis]|uniref:hypothetical protein n=1 Tax=Collinsella intestinalis TaxID=147207 RepID=UPI00195C27F4|nr:hypothetical protein [Collinsella intestinalis]MBM6683675.1 hypothetical protein [Collinsella intestinalis]
MVTRLRKVQEWAVAVIHHAAPPYSSRLIVTVSNAKAVLPFTRVNDYFGLRITHPNGVLGSKNAIWVSDVQNARAGGTAEAGCKRVEVRSDPARAASPPRPAIRVAAVPEVAPKEEGIGLNAMPDD